MVPEYCPVKNTEYSQEQKGSAVSYIPSIVGMAQAWSTKRCCVQYNKPTTYLNGGHLWKEMYAKHG